MMRLPERLGELPNADESILALVEAVVRDCAEYADAWMYDFKMTGNVGDNILDRYHLDRPLNHAGE